MYHPPKVSSVISSLSLPEAHSVDNLCIYSCPNETKSFLPPPSWVSPPLLNKTSWIVIKLPLLCCNIFFSSWITDRPFLNLPTLSLHVVAIFLLFFPTDLLTLNMHLFKFCFQMHLFKFLFHSFLLQMLSVGLLSLQHL